jgi:phosphatidylglycerol:prolipoprotein diacylglycerol transferase
MLRHPAFDPVAVAIGPVAIHWYGLMYLVGFAAAWWLMRRRARLRRDLAWRFDDIDDLLFWGAVGVIVGGRLGYVVFYNIAGWIEDPLMVFRIWEGGMAFHGGLIGVIVALTWFARRRGKAAWDVLDFVAPVVPIGLGAGRIGNFINGELWGRVTDVPWGMVFPGAGPEPRHPSQLYEFALEGVLLFAVLWWFSARPRPRMAVSGMFLVLYGVLRFAVELVRMPDRYFGLLLGDWLTMGQLLCVPMVIVGALMLYWAYRRPATAEAG